jgi:transposase
VIGTVQLGSWKTITFVAALRHNKMTTPMVLEGAMTGEMFLAYNCRVHMGTAIGAAINKAHAMLRSLPKYTPDLNPIELPYGKFKAFLRKVAARTVPGRSARMWQLFQACRLGFNITGIRFRYRTFSSEHPGSRRNVAQSDQSHLVNWGPFGSSIWWGGPQTLAPGDSRTRDDTLGCEATRSSHASRQ